MTSLIPLSGNTMEGVDTLANLEVTKYVSDPCRPKQRQMHRWGYGSESACVHGVTPRQWHIFWSGLRVPTPARTCTTSLIMMCRSLSIGPRTYKLRSRHARRSKIYTYIALRKYHHRTLLNRKWLMLSYGERNSS